MAALVVAGGIGAVGQQHGVGREAVHQGREPSGQCLAILRAHPRQARIGSTEKMQRSGPDAHHPGRRLHLVLALQGHLRRGHPRMTGVGGRAIGHHHDLRFEPCRRERRQQCGTADGLVVRVGADEQHLAEMEHVQPPAQQSGEGLPYRIQAFP